MKTGYVEFKDKTELLFIFVVPFVSQNVLVFVWKSVRSLKRNTDLGGDYFAAYIPIPNRLRRSGAFGEIHLVSGKVTTEIVAHEIGHLLYDWIGSLEGKVSSERFAFVCGKITSLFWKKYSKIISNR